MRLVDQYFDNVRADEVSELTALDKRRAKIAFFLRAEFFEGEFLPTLKSFREKHDPKPSDSKEDMLYHIGVRDGLKLVLDYVDSLRHTVRGDKNV